MMSDNKCLDIAKITPRMYAMSYPSDSFIESMYHNNQDDIAEYLNKYHPNKYLIFNLSGIPYTSEDKFNKSVITYNWPDHKAPPLSDIFNIIYQAYNFLGKDKENVICVHCLAGKGRTGTICCSLLLYGKLLKCSRDANNYFSTKRFKQLNKGVQEPSQVRYIEYFDIMMNNKNFNGLYLTMYEIKGVHITGIRLEEEGESITYKFETNYYKEKEAENYLTQNNGQIVLGDVTINIYRNDVLKAWIFFNTFFINPVNNRLFFNIKEIDPRFLLKDPDYSLMTIEIILYPYYHNNNQNNNFNSNMNNFNQNNNNMFNNNYNNNFNNNYNNNNYNNNNYNNNNYNNNNYNNNFNNNNYNNNYNNHNYKNAMINDMIEKENNRIKKMNEYLYYANKKNPSQFYQENKILFFGDENDDTMDVLNQIENSKNQ